MTEGIHDFVEETRKRRPRKADKAPEQMTDAELLAILDPDNTTA